MKLLSTLLLLLMVVGCSFKKDGSDSERVKDSSDQETLANALSSNFDKLVLAISTNDSKLFYTTLRDSKKSDLNQLSSGGRSLLEMALEDERLDYFRDLLKSGASPFRPTYQASLGLRNTWIPQREFRELMINGLRKLTAESTLICLKGDLSVMKDFLDENYIPSTYRTCGDVNLFEFYLNKKQLDAETKHFLSTHYLESTRPDFNEIVSIFLFFGFKHSDRDLLLSVGAACAKIECSADASLIDKWVEQSSVKMVLAAYEVLQQTLGELELKLMGKRMTDSDLPPPPPPGATEEDAEKVVKETVPAGIVTYVKMIVMAKIAKTPENEQEAMAQQLQELGLD